jgi:hypothetical protein
MSELRNDSLFLVSETLSSYFGRCYTLFRMASHSENFFRLGLKTKLNVNMYLHAKGDEFWLKIGTFPFPVAAAKIETKNADDLQVCFSLSLNIIFKNIFFLA